MEGGEGVAATPPRGGGEKRVVILSDRGFFPRGVFLQKIHLSID